ncbi:MAG: hypothetical protein IT310_08885 [Anaerolineales bacterium]|nr:hypothetical protein [Anaerolineales bacterium]
MMTPILLYLHSYLRWLIVLIGLIAIVKFTLGWLGKQTYQKVDRRLAVVFSGFMDLQGLLGLSILLWNGLAEGAGFPRYRLEHLGGMFLAIFLTHLQARFKNSADEIRFRNSALIILGALALITLSILVLPGK